MKQLELNPTLSQMHAFRPCILQLYACRIPTGVYNKIVLYRLALCRRRNKFKINIRIDISVYDPSVLTHPLDRFPVVKVILHSNLQIRSFDECIGIRSQQFDVYPMKARCVALLRYFLFLAFVTTTIPLLHFICQRNFFPDIGIVAKTRCTQLDIQSGLVQQEFHSSIGVTVLVYNLPLVFHKARLRELSLKCLLICLAERRLSGRLYRLRFSDRPFLLQSRPAMISHANFI